MTETGGATSAAVQIAETGGPEVMQLVQRPDPAPGEGEMTVAVAAAGVNFIDTYHRSGLYDLPLPVVLGQEGAGTVLEVGAGAEGFAPGDRVAWAGSMGSYAERAAVNVAVAYKVPDGVDLDTAAAIGVQGLTAHYLVTDCPRIGPGDRCLVHAGAGGTGRLVVQMAKLRGAEVVATVGSDAKVELARAAGADHVVNYSTTDLVAGVEAAVGPEAIDVVYDGVGAAVYDDSLELLRLRGSMVTFGNASGAVEPKAPLHLSAKSLWLTRPKLWDFIATREELDSRVSELFSWITAGKLDVRIAARLPMSEAAEAHRLLQGRSLAGKILLTP
ncbi:MAG: quinone oxidoreductase [Acidimicrobiaceae bacterium]|nr:quinone oxidoreductase [Acidimicrobiaceae bacterium]